MPNRQNSCTEITSTGSRGQVAGRRELNCKHTLASSDLDELDIRPKLMPIWSYTYIDAYQEEMAHFINVLRSIESNQAYASSPIVQDMPALINMLSINISVASISDLEKTGTSKSENDNFVCDNGKCIPSPISQNFLQLNDNNSVLNINDCLKKCNKSLNILQIIQEKTREKDIKIHKNGFKLSFFILLVTFLIILFYIL